MHITQQEKEKFLASLDEDALRDRVVRRLFKAIGFKDGRDLCGPEEFGKDALFIETDKFGEDAFVAVQTKVGAVTMAGDPTKNLHTILAQLRTALDHPYVFVRTKVRKLPSTVYLVASGVINSNARGYIQTQIPDPRLKFLDRDDLISKVDEHCPEIWSGIAAAISPYLKSLADRVEDLSVMGHDGNGVQATFGAFAAAADGAFIDLNLGFQDLVIERRSGKVYEDIRFGEIRGSELFRNDGVRALILGDAGSGKTTLLIRLAYMLAKTAVVSKKAYRLPIFTRASELLDGSGTVFDVLAKIVIKNHALGSLPFSIDDFDSGRVVLLVDGLDELALDADRQAVIDFCLAFTREYPKCSMALATRPYSSVDRLRGLENFKRFRVSPLSIKDASKMLVNLDRNKTDRGDVDWRHETLRKLEGVHGVELNPLLVTVFAVSAKVDKKDVPANITELFAKFAELMLGRWDEKKGLDQQYQAKVKEELLAEFAFDMHRKGDSTFWRKDFVDFASRRLGEIHLAADLLPLVTEILDRSGLLRGDEEMEFRHHLLQEFFAAKGIPDIEFVRSVIGSDWWRNSIVFYFGSSPKSVDELLDVATSNTSTPEDSFIAVGLALQACYMSKMSDRVDVWKWVNGAACQMLSRESSSRGAEKYPMSAFLAQYLEARDALALAGIEDESFDLTEWCSRGDEAVVRERHNFWYAVGLCELGQFGRLAKFLEEGRISDDVLLTAIHFGCFFAHELKSISSDQRDAVGRIIEKLNPVVEMNRHRITEEFRGQLLEYRRSGVVALDADEPEEFA